MENSFGTFLKQKRQEKNLTQKELAKILYISESAVNKWEKDVAYPSITLLPKLSEILDVSEHELITASIDKKSREEKSQAKKWRAFSMSWSLFFYISYAVALIPCFICNLAISKTLSWFWIVLSSLILAFTFTNLPKLIQKHKLLFIPLSMYSALCLLLGVCCIYTKGNWFLIASLSVLLGLIIIFTPIYIAHYKIFSKIRKFNDFVSFAVYFIALNLLLIVIDIYCNINNLPSHWYFTTALPIVTFVYFVINILLSVRFLKLNRLLKTSIILFLSDIFLYITPLFLKSNNPSLQKEIDDINIFKANLSLWNVDVTLEQNVHLIVFLSVLTVAVGFLLSGIILNVVRKHKSKSNNNE